MAVQGILLGLSLSCMVGPLLFAIVEAGLERGFRAGVSVGAGIWISDILYVVLVWRGLEALTMVTAWPQFRLWSGLAGGALLVAFGAASFLGKKPAMVEEANDLAEGSPQGLPVKPASPLKRALPMTFIPRTYAAYFLKGFLLNTINPFTIFFWLGVAGAMAAPGAQDEATLLSFFSGMLGTLVVTDTLKAWAAKRLRHFLTPRHMLWVRRGTGLALMAFGLVLALRNL